MSRGRSDIARSPRSPAACLAPGGRLQGQPARPRTCRQARSEQWSPRAGTRGHPDAWPRRQLRLWVSVVVVVLAVLVTLYLLTWTSLRGGVPPRWAGSGRDRGGCRGTRAWWGHTGAAAKRKAALAIGRLLPVHLVVAVAVRPAFVSILRLGRGYCGSAMVAGDAPGRVETVIAWSGGRRLHLLTLGEISEGRRASVEHAASRIADVDDLERALVRVFRHRVQRRIRANATPDVWFEVG